MPMLGSGFFGDTADGLRAALGSSPAISSMAAFKASSPGHRASWSMSNVHDSWEVPSMRETRVTLPELALIAGTRAALVPASVSCWRIVSTRISGRPSAGRSC